MEHYFTKSPKSLSKKIIIKTKIKGVEILINSDSGIFSSKEIDFGSKLLIENSKIKGKEVLDLGCGYGIIGIAIKKLNPDISLTLVDINKRAVSLTKENCSLNNIDANVFCSDLFAHPELSNKKFDTILTNPPFSAGKKICFNFIEQSFKHLNNNGILFLVAPHNKGGESLKKKMLEIFGNAGEVAKKAGFRVYIGIKN